MYDNILHDNVVQNILHDNILIYVNSMKANDILALIKHMIIL